jgi:hypothetical protein
MKYCSFTMVTKEMISMEVNMQPGAAPMASPLHHVFSVSLPPPREKARGIYVKTIT